MSIIFNTVNFRFDGMHLYLALPKEDQTDAKQWSCDGCRDGCGRFLFRFLSFSVCDES